MTIRMTGLASNLDTESMITALTSTYQTHVDDLKGQQKKLSWTQDKWKSLNKDILSFYNGTLELDLSNRGLFDQNLGRHAITGNYCISALTDPN